MQPNTTADNKEIHQWEMDSEMLEAIRDAMPADAPSRYGEITGVSTLDDVKDLVRDKQKALGLGEHCRQLRLALAEALQIVFSTLPLSPHEGSCGGPDSQCDQCCADAANAYSQYHRLFKVKNNPPHYFEAEAARNVHMKAAAPTRDELLAMVNVLDKAIRAAPSPDNSCAWQLAVGYAGKYKDALALTPADALTKLEKKIKREALAEATSEIAAHCLGHGKDHAYFLGLEEAIDIIRCMAERECNASA